MAKFTLTRSINAPREVVFAQISDFANAPKFCSGIKKIEMLTNGAVRVGTRFKETRIMFKREATETMEVVAFDPPKGYMLGAESCGCRYRTGFQLEPRGNGTEITMSFDAQPLSFFAKVMSFLMKPMEKMCLKMCEKELDDIKTSIEAKAK